jgi:hypothetical protein
MIDRVLKNPNFNIIFSIVLGMALVFIAHPLCKGALCKPIEKAPPVNEMNGKVYRYGEKCYKYKSYVTKCPKTGIIESFSEIVRRKADSLPMYNGVNA